MNRLQLAMLLSWAGETGIQGRKRLQKVVFFLQHAGCPLDCQYTLHYFGPYSRDVADACDELVAAGLIDERVEPQAGHAQYGYTLKPQTRELLRRVLEEHLEPFQPFELLGRQLIKENIWTLELGSTILFFYRETSDWDNAMSRACEFKKVLADADASKKAMELAQRVHSDLKH